MTSRHAPVAHRGKPRHTARPRAGTQRQAPRRTHGTTAAVLSGSLRWVEPAGSWAALLVADASGPGRGLIGHTVTLELKATRFRTPDRNANGRADGGDLLPGDAVTVKVRLPEALGAPLPAIAPVRLIADGT